MDAQQCANGRTAVRKWTHGSAQMDARQCVNGRTAVRKWTHGSASLRGWTFLIIFAKGSMNNQTHT